MTMSFFGKLKNLHSGPPAPPRRTDNNAGFEWPQDEFDDEEGDMYEVPPCERAPVKVPQRQVQENIYLERTSNPTVPQRQAAPPPPRPSKSSKLQQREEFHHDNNSKKRIQHPQNDMPSFSIHPHAEQDSGALFDISNAAGDPAPEIDRNEKPGRKKMPPPAVRPAPVPAPIEEDVYLDPNEEQEDNDDLYLEPEAACSPGPRGSRMPPSPMSAPACMMKPPVPRAKSNSMFPPMNEMKTALSVEERRTTFPTKLPPPPGLKPPLPVILKENKPSPPTPPVADKPVGGMRATRQPGNEDKEWFAGYCDRKMAEDLLERVNKDGAFLIRHSSAQSTRQPYTLAVLYQQKVYNIPIRFMEDTQGYALGKEGKNNEEIFSSLDEMVSYHKNNQLLLIDSRSHAKHTAHLTHPVRP